MLLIMSSEKRDLTGDSGPSRWLLWFDPFLVDTSALSILSYRLVTAMPFYPVVVARISV